MPMARKLGRAVTYFDGLLPIKLHNPLVKAFDKLKPLYLQYHNIYGYKTWYDGGTP